MCGAQLTGWRAETLGFERPVAHFHPVTHPLGNGYCGCLVMPRRASLCLVVHRHASLCLVVPRCTLSCLALHCRALSCLVAPARAPTCPAMPTHSALSCICDGGAASRALSDIVRLLLGGLAGRLVHELGALDHKALVRPRANLVLAVAGLDLKREKAATLRKGVRQGVRRGVLNQRPCVCVCVCGLS